MLARLKIGPKLLLAPAVVLALLLALSCGAYYAMVRQNQSLETIVDTRGMHMRSASDLVASAQKAHAGAYQLLAWISGSFPRARLDQLTASIHRQHDAVERGFGRLSQLTQGSGTERRYVDQAAGAWRVYVKTVQDVIELAQHDESVSASTMLKAEDQFGVVAQRLTELSRLEQQLSEQASDSAAEDFRMIAVLMPVVILLSIAASLAITMAVRRSLLAEVRGIGAAAIGLASGDLTAKDRIYGSDEIADTSRVLDASIRNLNHTLRTILESARSIGSTSREFGASLPSRAGVRATLEQTATSMQELAATVNQTADSAQAANRLAEAASSAAQKGGNVVDRLVTTMESVRGSSRRVVDLVGLIDAIASETGSLALNASMEAVRAGEHGREFALVASEVRSLALRTVTVAREVRELAAQSVAEIEGGTAWAAEAGTSMADLASSVQQVGTIISQISCASAEHASGLLEMNQAIVQMDEMTWQNSMLVEDTAETARCLQEQALALSRAVASFRLDEAVDAPAPDEAGPDPDPAGAQPVPHERRRARGHGHLRLASSRD